MTTPDDHHRPPASGRLVVHSSYHWLASVSAMSGAMVEINGRPSLVPWGQAPFDLPAGNYYVQVSAVWHGPYGAALLPVTVYPGQVVTVYYRPPANRLMPGSIGFTPQHTRGLAGLVAAAVILAVCIIVIVATVANF